MIAVKVKEESKSYYCRKYKHYKAKCPKVKNKGEDDKTSSSFVISIVEEKYNGSKLILAISDGGFNDTWVFEIACTFYMSHKSDWFVITSESINDSSILMENDIACRIIGIGTIKNKDASYNY